MPRAPRCRLLRATRKDWRPGKVLHWAPPAALRLSQLLTRRRVDRRSASASLRGALNHAGFEEFALVPLLRKLKEGDVYPRQSHARLGRGSVVAAARHRLLLSGRLTQLRAVLGPRLTLGPRATLRLVDLPLRPSGVGGLVRRAAGEQAEKRHDSHKSHWCVRYYFVGSSFVQRPTGSPAPQ